MTKQPSRVTSLWFYKWRYWLGYIGLVLISILVVAIAGFYAPDGIHQAEINSVIDSSRLNLGQTSNGNGLINLPFALLQKVSIRLFGLSNFSIKLPAMLFAGIAVLAFFKLLSVWASRRSAILASLVVITSSRLMFLSQHGTPTIALVALPLAAVAILVQLTEDSQILGRRPKLVTRSQRARLWLLLIGLATTFGGLLYLPMGGFMVFIIIATIVFHPSVRLALRNLQKILWRHYWILVLGWGLILMTPLVIASIQQPRLFLGILGVNFFNLNWLSNLQNNVAEIFFYQANLSSPYVGAWFSLSALVLIVVGVIREIKTTHQSRSAMILMWLGSGLILAVFSADSHILLFTPLALSLGVGLNYVIASWYQLFPRNPYARFFGLVPILILVVSLITTGLKGYVDSYRYHPLVARQFTNDLRLLDSQPRPFTLIVKPESNELAFYQLYARSRPKITIATKFNPKAKQTQIVTTNVSTKELPNGQLKTVLVNHFQEEADRFYVYKKSSN